MAKTPTPGRTTGTRPAPAKAPDSDEAVHRFEMARHGAASKAADAILVRALTFWDVLNCDEYAAFVRRVQREEATLRQSPDIRDDAGADKARQALEVALPAHLRETFGQYEDWLMFQGSTESEAAYLIGLAIGRGGAR